jgi:hypothetical protein
MDSVIVDLSRVLFGLGPLSPFPGQIHEASTLEQSCVVRGMYYGMRINGCLQSLGWDNGILKCGGNFYA